MSTVVTQLLNAPIVEAVIDIRVNPRTSTSSDEECCARFYQTIAKDYLPPEQMQFWNSAVTVGAPTGPSLQSSEIRRQKFVSRDTLRNIHIDSSGITFSRLKPYSSWAEFSIEFLTLWKTFSELYTPHNIIQFQLRYLNRFEFSEANVALQDYFLTTPVVAPALEKFQLSAYFMQFTITDPVRNSTCHIVQMAQPNPASVGPNIIFDISVFKQGAFDCQKDQVERELIHLHGFKNEVFFGSITEKTKEIYK